MKYTKYLILITSIMFFSCKNNVENKEKPSIKIETSKSFSEGKKTEIVTYYLINGRKLPKKDFHKIIFLNDNLDNVKIINYEGKDAFFTFKFSEALKFYNTKNKE